MSEFLFLVVVLIVVAPIAALVIAGRASRRIGEVESRLAYLEASIAKMRAREAGPPVEQTPQPHPPAVGAILETRPRPVVPPAIQEPLMPPEAPPQPTRVATLASSAATRPKTATAMPPPLVAPAQPPAMRAPDRTGRQGVPKLPDLAGTAVNWERFMGVKLFAWLGGLALFLAAAYFIKYSFDHNLIPAQVRVALGFLAGMGLLGGGVALQRREYRVTSQTLCGTGTVILYASAFAAHAVYHFPLFGQVPTFVVMSLITATAFLLAVRMDGLVIAVLGMLGGFLTPVLLSTGVDNPAGLFSYIALLDLGLLAVAFWCRWPFLIGLSALGTAVMQVTWTAQFFAVSKVFTALAILAGFDLLYLGAFLVARRQAAALWWSALSSAALSFLTMVFTFYLISYPELGVRPGVLALFLFGGDLCLLALVALQPRVTGLQWPAGGVAFLVLSVWTVARLDPALLSWALGLYFCFGLLHSVFPVLLRRTAPETALPPWMHLAAPLSLILVLLPILKLSSVSFLVWPTILLIDALAVVLALATGAAAALVGVLVLTMATVFFWVIRTPVESLDLSTALLLVGGFAGFFFAAGCAGHRWRRRESSMDAGQAGPGGLLPGTLADQVPAMAGVLPFTLLLLLIAKLPLPDPSGIFGLALLLVVLLLGLSLFAGAEILPAVALGSVLAVEYGWHLRHFASAMSPSMVLLWYIVIAGGFVLFPFLFRKRLDDRVLPWAVAALSAPLHFYLLHRLIKSAWPNSMMGLLPAACAVPMIVCLAILVKRFPPDHVRRNTVLALFGGAALFFLTLVFPIQFDRQWITIGWALEGVALCWLFHRVPHPGLRLVGLGLLVVAFVRLALNPAVLSYHPRTETPILNWYLYAYGAVAACMFLGARLLAPPRHRVLEVNAPPILKGLGAVLVFLLINLQIADYFTEAGEPTLTFRLGGVFARDMSTTIAWALYALVLVVFGLTRASRAARYFGIGLLVVTLLKLFLHDLANLAQLYRIGALAGVAIVAILASFLYQKFLASMPTVDNPSADTGADSSRKTAE